MPFALIAIGLLLIVTGIKGTQSQLAAQLASDFTGAGNFFYWIIAIMAIGAVGYIEPMKGPSRMLLALIIVAMVLSNKGFFAQFQQELQAGSAQAPPASSSSSGGGSTLSSFSGLLGGSSGSSIDSAAIGAAML